MKQTQCSECRCNLRSEPHRPQCSAYKAALRRALLTLNALDQLTKEGSNA